MSKLAPRERRLIAIGLLVAALALVWLAIVAPIRAGFAERALEREGLMLSFQRNQRLIAGMRATRGEARRQRDGAAQYELIAADREAALEQLRARVREVASAQGASLTAAEETRAPAGFVAVRADLTVPVPRLDQLLRALENRAPWLVVESFTIAADRALQSGRGDPVDVRIELAAAHGLAVASPPADARP